MIYVLGRNFFSRENVAQAKKEVKSAEAVCVQVQWKTTAQNWGKKYSAPRRTEAFALVADNLRFVA